jgi:hypothetical protein
VSEQGDTATVIRTERLVIRPWRLGEADRFPDLYRRPEVVRWFPAAPLLDRQTAVARIERRSIAQLAADGFATEAADAVLRRGFTDGLPEAWAVTHPANHRSATVWRRIGMQLLGITHRWYDEPSLMFWTGSRPGVEPSIRPDQPAPAEPFDT